MGGFSVPLLPLSMRIPSNRVLFAAAVVNCTGSAVPGDE